MNVVSTGTQLCDKCGKPLGFLRIATWQGTFHQECAGFSAATVDHKDARIAELEAALGPFAEYGVIIDGMAAHEDVVCEITVGDIRRARAALSSKEDGT